jgi:hypothetical protein
MGGVDETFTCDHCDHCDHCDETYEKTWSDEEAAAEAEELPRGDAGDVEVFEVSPDEYERAVRTALADLGLTYRQLERQARRGRFSSLRARKLWLAIGAPDGAR